MAVEAILQSVTAPATASLATKQFYAGTLDTSGGVAVAAATKNADGFIQDNPTAGQACQLAIFGISKAKITASTSITIGQLLEVDTAGTLKGVASGTVVAKALEALTSNAAVCTITVLILKSNAAYS